MYVLTSKSMDFGPMSPPTIGNTVEDVLFKKGLFDDHGERYIYQHVKYVLENWFVEMEKFKEHDIHFKLYKVDEANFHLIPITDFEVIESLINYDHLVELLERFYEGSYSSQLDEDIRLRAKSKRLKYV